MSVIVADRIFWIYFIITLFFVIIGLSFIITSNDPYTLVISIVWLLSNILLMIIVYDASRWWHTEGTPDICIVDANTWCLQPDNKIWGFINMLFILLLILGTIWSGELGNTEQDSSTSLSGVFILLSGLVLTSLITRQQQKTFPFWMSVVYLVIWFALTLYTTI